MTVAVVVLCDGCGITMGEGKSAKDVRAQLFKEGAAVALPGGEDFCPYCNPSEIEP